MSEKDTSQTYQEFMRRFLTSAAVDEWQAVLADLDQWRGRTKPRSLGHRLATIGGCRVAGYLTWLARWSGDYTTETESLKKLRRDSQVVETFLTAKSPTNDDLVVGQAVVLAYQGYRKQARRLSQEVLRRGNPDHADLACLLEPDLPCERAVFFRPFALQAKPFLPAVHRYGVALIESGRDDEVLNLFERLEQRHRSHPVITDLRCRIADARGDFRADWELANQSKWPVHQFRRCQAELAIHPKKELTAEEAETLRSFFTIEHAALHLPDLEIRPGEAARERLVTRLLESSPETFLAQIQAGILDFRTRRHRQAARCFDRARFFDRQQLDVTPEPMAESLGFDRARFFDRPQPPWSLLRLQFLNLTWLPGSLSCEPEAVEVAYELINNDDATRTLLAREGTAEARNWIAVQCANDSSLAPRNLHDPDVSDYEKGLSLESLDEPVLAVERFQHQVDDGLHLRAILRLISNYASWSCPHVVREIVGLLWENAELPFPSLLEFASVLRSLPAEDGLAVGQPHGHSVGVAPQLLDEVEMRLQTLSAESFQNLYRGAVYFLNFDSHVGERLLRQALELAETPEDYCLIAEAWRPHAPFDFDHRPNEIGGTALREALLRAQDRIDRLDLARLCNQYSRENVAKDILRQLGLFDRDAGVWRGLQPLEAALALDCQQCLTDEEFQMFADRAADNLNRRFQSGLIRKEAQTLFVKRLKDRIANRVRRSGQELWEGLLNKYEWFQSDSEDTTATRDPEVQQMACGDRVSWDLFKNGFREIFQSDPLEVKSLKSHLQRLTKIAEHESLEFVLAYSELLQKKFTDLLRESEIATPTEMSSAKMPLTHAEIDGDRAQRLTQLWQNKLRGDAASELEFSTFWNEERTLEQKWQQECGVARAANRRTAKLFQSVCLQVIQFALDRTRKLLEGDVRTRTRERWQALLDDLRSHQAAVRATPIPAHTQPRSSSAIA